jgi:hypothetical protein
MSESTLSSGAIVSLYHCRDEENGSATQSLEDKLPPVSSGFPVILKKREPDLHSSRQIGAKIRAHRMASALTAPERPD